MSDNFSHQTNKDKTVNVVGDNTIVQLRDEPKNPIENPQIVYNLAGFGKVYGRVEEAKILNDALCGKDDFAAKQFSLIIAPSGFGKSFLLSKTLHDVTDGTIIKPAYQQIVQRIIRLDCRHTQSIADIVSQFTNIIGLSFSYPQDFGHPFDYLNGVLFHYVRGIGKVWLILDNFEAWLDGEKDYQPINAEVETFLKALFEGNHSMRGVFLSQSLPVNFIRQQVKILDTVGDNLYRGLPETDALRMLKTEGASVGLNEVGDELLIEFLQKVAYIPQAINSLLGYMQDGITLQEVLHTPDFQQGFEEYESDAQKVEAGERRTNALIARQIKAQSADIQLLLQALAYFARPLPYEALEILFDDKLKARNAINRLKTHRLASETKDLSGTYYDLHTYFRKQTGNVLPDFSQIFNSEHISALLYKKSAEFYRKGFLQKAVDLCECAEKIYHELFNEGQTNLENNLALAKNSKGVVLDSQGKLDEAIASYNDAIKIYERLVKVHKQDQFASDLAVAYMNKGVTLKNQNKFDEAITNYENAVEILERLVNELRQDQRASDLAMVYMNKANVFYSQEKLDEAITSYDDGIKIYEHLVNKLKQDQFISDLAKGYWGKGVMLVSLGKLDEAIVSYDNAIKILESLVDEYKQDMFVRDLAMVYMNKGVSLHKQGRFDEAIESYDNSEKVRECWLQRGNYEVMRDFATNIRNRVITLLKLEDWQRAASDIITAFDFEGRWRDIELSEYFLKEINGYLNEIIYLLREVPAKKRKEIYKHASEYGGAIKELVEDFEEDEKNSNINSEN